MRFDVPTAMLMVSVLSFLTAVSLWLAQRHYPDDLARAVRPWALGLLLIAGGGMAFAVLDGRVRWMSILIGNLCMLLGSAQMLRGVLRLWGSDAVARRWEFISLLAVAGMLLLYGMDWPAGTRMIVFSLVTAAMQWHFISAATQIANPKGYAGVKLLRWVGVLGLGIMLLRSVVTALTLDEPHLLMSDRSLPQVLALMYGVVFQGVGSLAFVLICQDRLVAQVQEIAHTDPLTGLPNRRDAWIRMRELEHQETGARQSSAAILCDIDHFKTINDQCGHDVGDQVLIQLGELLRSQAPPGSIVARWGGEEFLLVLPASDAQRARVVAEQLRVSIEAQKINGANAAQHLSASFGVAVQASANPTERFENVLQRADQALYEAKRAGRNRVALAKDVATLLG